MVATVDLVLTVQRIIISLIKQAALGVGGVPIRYRASSDAEDTLSLASPVNES
jgi:hypothetical protein